MKKGTVIALVVMASVSLAASVMAQSGGKEECVTLCKDAAAFMNEKGFYPTVFEINRKGGKFVSKNTYVFLVDLEGHLLAHPYNQQYIGMDMKGQKDMNGTLYVQDYLKVAKSSKGEP